MNPLEEAIYNEILEVEDSIEARKKIKQGNEELENFNDQKRKVFSLGDKDFAQKVKKAQENKEEFSVVTEYTMAFGYEDLKEVDGGYETEVVLLEDGYIPGRVVFTKKSTAGAVKQWGENKQKLLVDDSHIRIDTSILLGSLGAITELKTVKFAKEEGGKKDRTRAMATVFLDKSNPATQYIVEMGRKMNEQLKKAGKNYAIFSVSAEIEFDDYEFKEFGQDFVPYIDEYRFTGMAICFNPANLSSFGTVADLSEKGLNIKDALNLNDEQVILLNNLLKQINMSKEKKLNDEEVAADPVEVADPVEEVTPAETPAEVVEETPVEETPVEETPVEEPAGEEPKGEEPKEDDEAGALKALTENYNTLESNYKNLEQKLSELETQISTLSTEKEELAKKNGELETKVTELQASVDAAGGEIETRVPATGKKGEELTAAQRVSKYGKK